MQTLLNQPIIGVNASALKAGGALTVLREFIAHIQDENHYYIFINKAVDLNTFPCKNTIHLIPVNVTGAIGRIVWDWFGFKRWFSSRNLVPKVVISLQNTSIATAKESKLIIYLHQGLALHGESWSFFKRKERSLAFYKYVYPLFIFMFAKKNTQFVVQTQWMQQALCSRFKREKKYVHVIKPNLIPIDVGAVPIKVLEERFTLFYPATSMVFKNHKELVYALHALDKSGQDMSEIGLYLTIREEDDRELLALINQLNLKQNIHFLGALSYDDVLVYYKSCTTVVFPSYIESFGLPLLEAAMFAKPLVVMDADYSREVISDYPGAIFAQRNDPKAWCDAIRQSMFDNNLPTYQPTKTANWDDFFKLVSVTYGQ